MLRVFVGNDGQVGSMEAPHNGSSLAGGMRNISERLIRLYGEAHNLQAEPRTDGGFNVSIGIPLRDTTTPDVYWDFHR